MEKSLETNPARRRPGPFGPARVLLPEDQKIEFVRDNESTALALGKMVDTGFSQLPVKNEDSEVVGVFSWQSFGKRMSEIHSLNLDLSILPVKDTDLERPNFIAPETYIDTATDWSRLDYVLVGDQLNVLGVLTITDVLGRLNDFAEAFVLLYEIEHEIRDLILDVYSEDELKRVFEGLSDNSGSPEERLSQKLMTLLDMQEISASPIFAKPIKSAADLLLKASKQRPIYDLNDFTFAQYRMVIFSAKNWDRFQTVFDTHKDLLNADFEVVNNLRNDIFHFRRSIRPTDTDRLRRFRDKLRYNRELARNQ